MKSVVPNSTLFRLRKNLIIFEVQGKSTQSERSVSKHLSITKE